MLSGFGLAVMLNGLNESETPRLKAGDALPGVMASVAVAPVAGTALVTGVSVRVPELCPVVPAVPEIFSQEGTPVTVKEIALPSLAPIATVLGCGSPLP
jgi:hypothetical protein